MSVPHLRHSNSRLMLRLTTGTAALLLATGFAARLGVWLIQLAGWSPASVRMPLFVLSTVLLTGCSIELTRAQAAVNREKQQLFRQHLSRALSLGCGFVLSQCVGLWCLVQLQRAEDVATGTYGFVITLTAVHALHVTVAILCLVFVSLQAGRNRYDHEYSWGVTFCGWFWHALGMIWLAILVAMLIAT